MMSKMAIKHAHSRCVTLGGMCIPNSLIYTRSHSLSRTLINIP